MTVVGRSARADNNGIMRTQSASDDFMDTFGMSLPYIPYLLDSLSPVTVTAVLTVNAMRSQPSSWDPPAALLLVILLPAIPVPLCPPPLDINHALWEYAKTDYARQILWNADGTPTEVFERQARMFGNNRLLQM